MILFIKGLENNYEIEMLSRMFFPQLSLAEDRELDSLCENEDYLFANREITGENQQLCITLHRNGEVFSESGSMAADAAEREYNLALSRMLYRCAVKSGCDELRWGILTGIRPIKLFHALHAKGMTDSEINAEIKRDYLISDEMAALITAQTTAQITIQTTIKTMVQTVQITVRNRLNPKTPTTKIHPNPTRVFRTKAWNSRY